MKDMGIGQLLQWIRQLSRTQAIVVSVAAIVAAGSIGTGGYLLYQQYSQPKDVVAENDTETGTETETDAHTESEMVTETETQPESETDTEVVETPTESETETVELRQISLSGSSMEKDLKVKILDKKSKRVRGENFEISVKASGKDAKAATYVDDDKDGIIHITKLEPGKYTVALMPIEGYEIVKGTITVKVKDKLAYEKVDVDEEIKTEDEIDAGKEDAADKDVPEETPGGTPAEPEKPPMKDTVDLIESTTEITSVDRSEVDMSVFPKAEGSKEQDTAECGPKIPQEPGEKPDEGEEEDKPESSETESSESKSSESESQATAGADRTTTGDGSETDSEQEPEQKPDEGEDKPESHATVAIPKKITMYVCENAASNSYKSPLTITGDASVIKNITWEVANAEVATVSAETGTDVTLNAVNAGETIIRAIITYATDEKGTTATAVLQSTVSVELLTENETQLQDMSGNLLYLDKKGKTPALIRDYNTQETFYTGPLYTGWQTLDGKVYYYDANHKLITGEQVIGGVKYTFSEDGSLAQISGNKGIDVSKWQGEIDWGAVASSGISFAIIRAGYRGAVTGALVEDPYFKKNIEGATKAGIKVGVYFFTQAITEAEAVEEASMVLSLVKGYKVTYPIFIDTENATNGRANGLDVATRTAVCKAFCQTIQNGGYKAGVYASKNWYNTKLNTSELNSYTIWVAQYNTSCNYTGRYDMWQHSCKGTVPGIKGYVDLNYSYLGY